MIVESPIVGLYPGYLRRLESRLTARWEVAVRRLTENQVSLVLPLKCNSEAVMECLSRISVGVVDNFDRLRPIGGLIQELLPTMHQFRREHSDKPADAGNTNCCAKMWVDGAVEDLVFGVPYQPITQGETRYYVIGDFCPEELQGRGALKLIIDRVEADRVTEVLVEVGSNTSVVSGMAFAKCTGADTTTGIELLSVGGMGLTEAIRGWICQRLLLDREKVNKMFDDATAREDHQDRSEIVAYRFSNDGGILLIRYSFLSKPVYRCQVGRWVYMAGQHPKEVDLDEVVGQFIDIQPEDDI